MYPHLRRILVLNVVEGNPGKVRDSFVDTLYILCKVIVVDHHKILVDRVLFQPPLELNAVETPAEQNLSPKGSVVGLQPNRLGVTRMDMGSKNSESTKLDNSKSNSESKLVTHLIKYKNDLLKKEKEKATKSKSKKKHNNHRLLTVTLFKKIDANVETIKEKKDLRSVSGLGPSIFDSYGDGIWEVIQKFNSEATDSTISEI